jgi:hypothetical protein
MFIRAANSRSVAEAGPPKFCEFPHARAWNPLGAALERSGQYLFDEVVPRQGVFILTL